MEMRIPSGAGTTLFAANFGGIDSDSDYVKSADNSPMSSANTLDLEGHITELEMMHEVLEGEINAIFQPMVIFSHTNEIKILELDNA